MCPQLTLFSAEPEHLLGDVRYISDFIGVGEANRFLEAFRRLEWRPHDYFKLRAPRQYVWMGVHRVRTRMLEEIVVIAWTPEAEQVKSLVEERTGYQFNSLSLQLFADQTDSLYWQSDPEQQNPIVIVSFGEVRRFKWRSRKDGSSDMKPLANGSLLVMPPGFQQDHLHAFLKQQKKCGPRVGLTFRRIA